MAKNDRKSNSPDGEDYSKENEADEAPDDAQDEKWIDVQELDDHARFLIGDDM